MKRLQHADIHGRLGAYVAGYLFGPLGFGLYCSVIAAFGPMPEEKKYPWKWHNTASLVVFGLFAFLTPSFPMEWLFFDASLVTVVSGWEDSYPIAFKTVSLHAGLIAAAWFYRAIIVSAVPLSMRTVEERGIWYLFVVAPPTFALAMLPTYWNPSMPYLQGAFILVSPAVYPIVGQGMSVFGPALVRTAGKFK